MQSTAETYQDPRATIIKNVGQQQQFLQQILKQIPNVNEEITLDKLIQLYQKCQQIRQEPQFIQALFNNYKIYQQYIEWILLPLTQIENRKKALYSLEQIHSIQNKFPYICMKIAKDNDAFYQQLYIKSYFEPQYIKVWFQFLYIQQNQQVFETSLGYFSEIMIQFLKYEFCQSSKICDLITYQVSKEALMSSSQIQREQTLNEKQKKLVLSQKKRTYIEQQISILGIFSDQLLNYIMKYINHEAIFKFIHNLILISLQENDLRRSKHVFQLFLSHSFGFDIDISQRLNLSSKILPLEKSILNKKIDICSEFILEILNQIYANANTQKNYRVIFFIDSMVRMQLINFYIKRIQNSSLLLSNNNNNNNENSQNKGANVNNSSNVVDFNEVIIQEQLLQNFLKSLSLMLKIYSKMIKNKKSSSQIQRQSKFFYQQSSNQIQNSEQVKKIQASFISEQQLNGQSKVIKQFGNQIKIVFQKLPQLSQLVKKNQSCTLPFSSGQNIKMITRCKYDFFQLIYNCLLLARQYQDQFIVDTDKINIFSIIQRYLSQNRWNNIAHKILQKIAFLLIENNKNFFRTIQMKKNNMADGFLDSIIQNFTNKNYIFLNSFRFTTQGNIHTLYMVAKAIINQLRQSHQLANFIHEFQYYKKFVINDLQNYQTKLFEIKYLPDEQSPSKSTQKSQQQNNDCLQLQVDEVDELLSIKQIVKKIQIINKWSTRESKRNKRKTLIHRRSLSYISDDHIQITNSIKAQTKQKINPSSSNLNGFDLQNQKSDGYEHYKRLKDTRQYSSNYVNLNRTPKQKITPTIYEDGESKSNLCNSSQIDSPQRIKLSLNLHKTSSIQIQQFPIIDNLNNKSIDLMDDCIQNQFGQQLKQRQNNKKQQHKQINKKQSNLNQHQYQHQHQHQHQHQLDVRKNYIVSMTSENQDQQQKILRQVLMKPRRKSSSLNHNRGNQRNTQ